MAEQLPAVQAVAAAPPPYLLAPRATHDPRGATLHARIRPPPGAPFAHGAADYAVEVRCEREGAPPQLRFAGIVRHSQLDDAGDIVHALVPDLVRRRRKKESEKERRRRKKKKKRR